MEPSNGRAASKKRRRRVDHSKRSILLGWDDRHLRFPKEEELHGGATALIPKRSSRANVTRSFSDPIDLRPGEQSWVSQAICDPGLSGGLWLCRL